MRETIRDAVMRIVKLLVEGKCGELARLSENIHLTEDEIALAVRDYGRRLVMPPAEEFDSLELNEMTFRPGAWAVTMDLYTEEQGRSDLSIELTIIETERECRVEIDGIHIM